MAKFKDRHEMREDGEYLSVHFTPEYIRNLLVHQALKERPSLRDKVSRSKVPADIIYHHHRTHTVSVRHQTAARAITGNLCFCMYALEIRELPGVVASAVLRRVSYTLEPNEHGQYRVYKFGTPDIARRRQRAFDRGEKMIEHSVVFRPLPFSRTPKGIRLSAGSRGPQQNPSPKRRNSRAGLHGMRTMVPRDLAPARRLARARI